MRLRVLGSMATRGLLAELAGDAELVSIGGVAAAARVRAGEPADVVVLAAPAMRQLETEGHLLAGSLAGIVVSSMVAAVREGAPRPDLSDADAVRRAVLAAGRTGYSTGPSGDHLLRLLDEWGILETLGDRLVQAPPGVPVGRLLAEGAVDLGFQQRSEFMGLDGVDVVGALPAEIAADTVFTAGIAAASTRRDAARELIERLAAPASAQAKLHHGMEPWEETA